MLYVWSHRWFIPVGRSEIEISITTTTTASAATTAAAALVTAAAALVTTATNNNKMNHFFEINSRQEIVRDYGKKRNPTSKSCQSFNWLWFFKAICGWIIIIYLRFISTFKSSKDKDVYANALRITKTNRIRTNTRNRFCWAHFIFLFINNAISWKEFYFKKRLLFSNEMWSFEWNKCRDISHSCTQRHGKGARQTNKQTSNFNTLHPHSIIMMCLSVRAYGISSICVSVDVPIAIVNSAFAFRRHATCALLLVWRTLTTCWNGNKKRLWTPQN